MTTELARPRPTLPSEVELDRSVGQYGGSTSGYVKRLLDRSRQISTRTLNAKIISDMRRHYQVSAALIVQQLPLVRADWSIECDDDDVREFLTAAYGRVSFGVHRSMSRATWAGYSPNSIEWTADPELGGIVPAEIRDLAPDTCKPVTDEHGDLDGFEQTPPGTAKTTEIDAYATLWVVEGMESGNYYGRSILEAALDPWADWTAIRAFHARYLERFGEPVVKGRAPSGQTVTNQAEIQTAAAEDPPRTVAPVFQDNVGAIRTVGENLRHHSVVALPGDLAFGSDGKPYGYAWDLEYLESKAAGGTDFLDALRECDKRITRACFIPDLLFTNSETGAYALGKSHRDVWGLSVEGRLDDYSRQISDQLIERMRVWNFGESAPGAKLVFSPQSDEDRDRLWSVAETLIETGRLPVDVEEIASRVGLPIGEDAGPPAPVEQSVPRETIQLTAGHVFASTDPVAGLPEWKIPSSYDPPPFRRELNARERRVDFGKIEAALNTTEARVIENLTDVLERERERVLRQLTGIMRKGTTAEILDALATVDVKGGPEISRAWSGLMADTSGVALEALRSELAAYADSLPSTLGAEGNALFRGYAQTAADRTLAAITSETRLQLLNAYTSGVSRAGMASVVSQIFDAYEGSEGKPVRLTTRNLSAKSLNYSRAAAVERGGVPLAGAQYSAILDRRTCELCGDLDEKVIPIESTDLARFTPPIHHNCRCLWVWITREEEDFTPTWSTPATSKVDRYGGLVF